MGQRRKNKGEKRERVNQSQHTGMEERKKERRTGKKEVVKTGMKGVLVWFCVATKHAHKSERWNNEKKRRKRLFKERHQWSFLSQRVHMHLAGTCLLWRVPMKKNNPQTSWKEKKRWNSKKTRQTRDFLPTGDPTVAWGDHGNNTLEGRSGVLVDNDLSLACVRFCVKEDAVAAALLDELFTGLEDVAPQTRTQVLCAFRDDHRPRRRVRLQRLRFVCHVSRCQRHSFNHFKKKPRFFVFLSAFFLLSFFSPHLTHVNSWNNEERTTTSAFNAAAKAKENKEKGWWWMKTKEQKGQKGKILGSSLWKQMKFYRNFCELSHSFEWLATSTLWLVTAWWCNWHLRCTSWNVLFHFFLLLFFLQIHSITLLDKFLVINKPYRVFIDW